VRAVGKVWDERFGERERPEVVGREGEIPPLRLFAVVTGMMPALFSKLAIVNRSAMISAAARRTLARSDKSQTTDTACPPFCLMAFRTSSSFLGSRATSTRVPCFASSSAVARPIPEVGPVMMYALPSVQFFKVVFDMLASAVCFSVCLASHQQETKNQHTILQRASKPALQCFFAFAGCWAIKSIIASATEFVSASTNAIGVLLHGSGLANPL